MNDNHIRNFKNQQNYVNQLKRLAMKKRGVVSNVTSKNHDLQKLTEERKNHDLKKLTAERRNQNKNSSRYSKAKNPIVLTSDRKRFFKNPNRNLEKLYYKSALVSLENKKVTRLDLPHGCFNAGIATHPEGGYICVYRPDEYSFKACLLNKEYQVEKTHHHKFKFTNCADPRLIWFENNTKLLMVYSSTTEGGISRECIRGTIIMDLNKSNQFMDNEPFRISPAGDERHKNWIPFVYENSVFLISNVIPHKIYELNTIEKTCEFKYENKWFSPWPIKESLRGNTNAARLNDGNYLGTFHTATWIDNRCHYDNGVYIFEGKPPFKVLKCSNKTFLPAEDAVEPHYRKSNSILCTFPIGMIVEDEKVIISYGDNDSSVKILETSLGDLKNLMVEVY
jgi:predicted GH43/DUF377 family glycosyl hydrolase